MIPRDFLVEVPPHALARVVVRRVGGQQMNLNPALVLPQVLDHRMAGVEPRVVADHMDRSTASPIARTGGHSRAEEWRRIGGTKVVRDRGQSARDRDHRLGVAAIMMNAGDRLVATIHEISPPTRSADAAMAAQEADADTLADL